MRAKEKSEVIKLIIEKVRKRGIPVNVRNGGNEDAAEWTEKLLEELLPVDEPRGVVQGVDYDHCPECGRVVGSSGYFCKYCGTYLKEVSNDQGK